MLTLISCRQCDTEVLERREDSYVALSPTEKNYYICECSNGHSFPVVMSVEQFSVLFEMGCAAIIDGYYREAVSNFSASLERFYEFYCGVICYKDKISEKETTDTVRRLASNSERELGAYSICYLLENGISPVLLPDSKRKFRNDVIHKGLIPDMDSTKHFGSTVYDLICPVFNNLKKTYIVDIKKFHKNKIAKTLKEFDADEVQTDWDIFPISMDCIFEDFEHALNFVKLKQSDIKKVF